MKEATPTRAAPRIETTIKHEQPHPPGRTQPAYRVEVDPATLRAMARPPLDGPGPGRGELVALPY